MRKRIVAMLLGLMLFAGSLAGCGNTAGKEETTAPQSEVKTQEEPAEIPTDGEIPVDYFAGTELTIALLKAELDTIAESPAVKVAAQMAEEATGIKINWITVDNAAKQEKLSVMLASDMPDAMIGLLDQDTMASNLDLFYDLSEEGLLETYAPNVLADLECWTAN